MYLVNLQKLFSSDVIKAFKDNKDVENWTGSEKVHER
jgi:hypothetical protein